MIVLCYLVVGVLESGLLLCLVLHWCCTIVKGIISSITLYSWKGKILRMRHLVVFIQIRDFIRDEATFRDWMRNYLASSKINLAKCTHIASCLRSVFVNLIGMDEFSGDSWNASVGDGIFKVVIGRRFLHVVPCNYCRDGKVTAIRIKLNHAP